MSLIDKAIIRKLLSLQLPTQDYVIFGSGPLLAHDIRSNVRDLDILARASAWRKALDYGVPLATPPSGNGNMVVFFDGQIEIFDRWVSDEWNVDQLIDNAEIIEGLPFVPLATVLCWKKSASREKDNQDILDLERYVNSHPSAIAGRSCSAGQADPGTFSDGANPLGRAGNRSPRDG